jgi:hypothetical protein
LMIFEKKPEVIVDTATDGSPAADVIDSSGKIHPRCHHN